ncbi:CapA family protein [Nguyenibacter vanlangensis]|uniref:CapA family protein n=1 Tax=Nguyenibacter vanlangensis TaxID=1216886 RepID=A0ABZ3DA32_9PROT
MKISLTGDSILFRRLNSLSDPTCRGLFDKIRACDVSFTNLEMLPSNFEGDPVFDHGGSHFSARPWVLDDLSEAGFSLFAAATNHSLDYGVAGVRAALDCLEARGILFAGVGRTLEAARRPVYATHPQGTVAMISCCSTFARGQEAADQTRSMQGRPGLNPLRHKRRFRVTPGDMAVLREMYERLGLASIKEQQVRLGFEYPPPAGTLPFAGLDFVMGESCRMETLPDERDVQDIERWTREAAHVSDVVIVSLHTHDVGYGDDGETNWETPAAFVEEFARRIVDAGADIVVCHGQHLLKGMEIHKGKVIFYGLGNFIGQNELIEALPRESYEFYKVPMETTTHMVYRARTENDRKGFPADRRFWETIVPICRFDEDGALSAIEILPVSLGLGKAAHKRGVPFLAEGHEGTAILRRFADLSGRYGTRLRDDGALSTVML